MPEAKKVCVVTGSRAEYGILRPVMRRIGKSRRLSLQVIAAGMHLAGEFGHTVDHITSDGFHVDARVKMLPENDTPAAMAQSVGRGIVGFTKAFGKLESDVVVVLGDRTESFAAAAAAALSGKVLAHIHGGDRAEGGYDDYMRHAITKMAHIHFAATEGAARRIRRLGELRKRIFVVGAPGLDEIHPTRLPAASATKKRYGFPPRKPLILAVQHSISTHPKTAAGEIEETLRALEAVGLPTILVYPNSDAGSRAMTRVIARYEGRAWLRTARSLPRSEFLAVMKAATVMVGNSSSGIIEAASLHLGVVNIGRRQAGRQRAGNTLDVKPNANAIEKAVRSIVFDTRKRKRLESAKNIYGDGRASSRIVGVLEGLEIGPDILRKQITY
ncbi:MAG: UDP-N-acetylglucosamine 2-epimerase (hydrolyzing) [Planctomycetes bacterium]|nr:UDP-N-acetylglucosamine 2-epimerase (hydrolyzing) [Planctomycetota bacterium]